MTTKSNREILEKAIQKAIDNGFSDWWTDICNSELYYLSIDDGDDICYREAEYDTPMPDYNFHLYEVVFNKQFARALWGEQIVNLIPRESKEYFIETDLELWQCNGYNKCLADIKSKWSKE